MTSSPRLLGGKAASLWAGASDLKLPRSPASQHSFTLTHFSPYPEYSAVKGMSAAIQDVKSGYLFGGTSLHQGSHLNTGQELHFTCWIILNKPGRRLSLHIFKPSCSPFFPSPSKYFILRNHKDQCYSYVELRATLKLLSHSNSFNLLSTMP